MKKVTGFKSGYYIRIINGFYEVISGNKCCYYGYCKKDSTVEEIVSKTIGIYQEGMDDNQRFRNSIRTGRKEGIGKRNQDNGAENLVSL